MALTEFEFITGLSCLLIVVISIIVGFLMALKYIKHKKITLLLVGVTWIGIVEVWYPAAISFILILIMGSGLTSEMHFFFAFFFIPITINLWLFAFTELTYKKKQKIIQIIYIILGVIFEIGFLYFLINDPTQIGVLEGPFNGEYNLLIMGWVLLFLLTFIFTGIIFALDPLKSKIPEMKLKGKFLLMAFISFGIGSIIDGYLSINVILLIIIRLFLISSVIEFYMGFILPDWIKKLFLKKK